MRIILLFLSMSVALSACNTFKRNQVTFDGFTFRASASKVDRVRENFAITVRPASRSLTGALDAGRHAAIRYCIQQFGSSDIAWDVGPDQDPESYEIRNDTLNLNGTCTP